MLNSNFVKCYLMKPFSLSHHCRGTAASLHVPREGGLLRHPQGPGSAWHVWEQDCPSPLQLCCYFCTQFCCLVPRVSCVHVCVCVCGGPEQWTVYTGKLRDDVGSGMRNIKSLINNYPQVFLLNSFSTREKKQRERIQQTEAASSSLDLLIWI